MDLGTKVKWFERGATALREIISLPQTARSRDSALYACPLCPTTLTDGETYSLCLITRAGLESGELTAEHVPPKSFGGRELVLTCRACNNEAGSGLEAHARRRENPIDMITGQGNGPSRVRVRVGDHFVNAELTRLGGDLNLRVPLLNTHANSPAEITEFEKALATSSANQTPLNVNFRGDAYHEQRANVAWLKQGYLVLFALLGYRYIFSKGLGIVRKQIQEPDVRHIPRFLTSLPEQRPWSDRGLTLVKESAIGAHWLAQVGRHLVVLPLPGDDEVYARWQELIMRGERPPEKQGASMDSFEWPTEPLFGLSPATLNAE